MMSGKLVLEMALEKKSHVTWSIVIKLPVRVSDECVKPPQSF